MTIKPGCLIGGSPALFVRAETTPLWSGELPLAGVKPGDAKLWKAGFSLRPAT